MIACAHGTGGTSSDSEAGVDPGDASRDRFVLPGTDSGSDDTGTTGNDSGGCNAKVVINELRTSAPEMIELYNPGSCAVPLGNWALKYQSGGGVAGSAGHKFAVGDSILAGGYVVLVPGDPSTPLTTGLSGTDGQVGLVNDKGMLVDAVAYGPVTAGMYREKGSAPAPASGGSIGRKPNGVDTDNNSADFQKYATPSQGVANP